MKDYLIRLKQKMAYNSLWRILHDGFTHIGIKLTPFYLVVEGFYGNISLFESDVFKNYTMEYLNEEDMREVGAIPTREQTEEVMVEYLKQGCVCLGVKHHSQIVAFTWFNLKECPYFGCPFDLKDYEAYLFDAYTLIPFRGKKLAPFMRYHCYKELKKTGRTTLYSISEIQNNQSIQFKKKLNAKFVLLGIYIRLFNKWKYRVKLKEIISKEDYVQR